MLGFVILAVIGLNSVHPVRHVSWERFARGDYAKCIEHGKRVVKEMIAEERRLHREVRMDVHLDCEEQITFES